MMTMQIQPSVGSGYPEHQAAQQQVATRRRRGQFWATVFLASTLIGIIALISLLINIIDGTFGYVALQNEVDPAALVLQVEEQNVLAAPNLVSSESDTELAAGIESSPYAIGFFGYAYLQEHADSLRAAAIEGIAPSAESLAAGDYKFSRPLLIYSAPDILRDKPQVAAFLDYYLTNVSQEVVGVGYFTAGTAELEQGKNALQTALNGASATSSPSGDILAVGSSTVYPLTQRMADQFKASGFSGNINIEVLGTKAGLVRFCQDRSVDIANASRPITRAEIEACRKAKREPIGFEVATDALAVVVSKQNTFVNDLTVAQLRQIFTTAQTWADVNPAWPAEPILRYIPGVDSGTLDFFVETVYGGELRDVPKETLIAILEANVSRGLIRRFENDQPFAERTQENVYELVRERVVASKVVQSWSLTESLFKRSEIEATVATVPNGELEWRSWVSNSFITSEQDASPDKAGIRPAILGSLWVILFTLLIALPIGVGAAIYLEEYAAENWLNQLIETNINNLAGVPSIIYGMLGLAIFVRVMEPFTSGELFGLVDATTANGRTVVSAGLTLALLVLPLIIINAREAIRAVPDSLRQAGFGLGATKWQVIWAHVLPNALPGILTGNILAMSRAIGETAPLVVVGASTFIALDPNGPFAKFTTLPAQIYQWTSRPQAEFHHIAAAAIVVLLVMLLSLNATAVFLRNRYSVRL